VRVLGAGGDGGDHEQHWLRARAAKRKKQTNKNSEELGIAVVVSFFACEQNCIVKLTHFNTCSHMQWKWVLPNIK